jgi:maleylpyruvate isomerase
MKLYSYFRSSAAYRVRIALNLKGLSYETVAVHLLRDGGEHLRPDYRALNPDAILPTFIDGDEVMNKSLAIIEYLDETYREPPLLPGSAADRAFIRSIALQVACEIHPLDNLRVLRYLKHELCVADDAKNAWYRHWVESGFASLETRLAGDARVGTFCFGDTPTLADLCLVPQMSNARRFNIDVSRYPTIVRIVDHAEQLDAFQRAAPAQQPDAE